MRSNRSDRNLAAIRLADCSLPVSPAELYRCKLNELGERLAHFHAFGKGQFVKWKVGLKNREFPAYGEPVIVTGVLRVPVFDPCGNSAASPYFREPLTVVIGTCRDDEFLEYRVDGRRLEPFAL